MTLPFNNNRDERKWTCFCCGVQFSDCENFKNHIIEKHEEGRDYVLCKIPWCGMPVRCIPTHHKCAHKSTPLPKTGQMKAILWRDFSAKGKPKVKRKFKDGWYESTKMNKRFYFRSGWEAQVYECLDQMNEVAAYEAEPFKIPYIWNGSQHDYNPDLLVIFTDGHKEVWEIKPSDQTSLQQNKNKWYAANEVCKARGWEFIVQTEVGIQKMKKRLRKK
jgi:hypothetical protein